MLHWIAIILGIIFTLFQLFYAFIVICSLIENTGYKILSVVFGICHAGRGTLFCSKAKWKNVCISENCSGRRNIRSSRKHLSPYQRRLLPAGTQRKGAVSESVEFCHSYAEKRRIYQTWSEF